MRATASLVLTLTVASVAAAQPPPAPPSGWKPWPSAPPGCAIWIPERPSQLAALAELTWKRCPFAATGCDALGATWAARTGWGFGGRLSAASDGTHTFVAFTRAVSAAAPDVPGSQWETIVVEDDGTRRAPIA